MNRPFYQALSTILSDGGSVVLGTVTGCADQSLSLAEKAFCASGSVTAQAQSHLPFWTRFFQVEKTGPLPRMTEFEGCRILLEPFYSRPSLVICGGGHIAAPLAQIGALLDFDVTVADDRAEFANAERFPAAKQVICAPFSETMQSLAYSQSTCFVIITRGHADDRLCLEQILRHPFGYVGMIGSRRKVSVVMEEMLRQGYEKDLLDRVHAPIGLKIGAQTPAEIAVCIAAEIIQERGGAASGILAPEALELLSGSRPAMLATVIEKRGSSPRGVGAKLLADESGLLSGTIGGGAGEAQAIALAKEVLAAGVPRVIECNMTNDDARKAGMVCGGVIRVLLEPVG